MCFQLLVQPNDRLHCSGSEDIERHKLSNKVAPDMSPVYVCERFCATNAVQSSRVHLVGAASCQVQAARRRRERQTLARSRDATIASSPRSQGHSGPAFWDHAASPKHDTGGAAAAAEEAVEGVDSTSAGRHIDELLQQQLRSTTRTQPSASGARGEDGAGLAFMAKLVHVQHKQHIAHDAATHQVLLFCHRSATS